MRICSFLQHMQRPGDGRTQEASWKRAMSPAGSGNGKPPYHRLDVDSVLDTLLLCTFSTLFMCVHSIVPQCVMIPNLKISRRPSVHMCTARPRSSTHGGPGAGGRGQSARCQGRRQVPWVLWEWRVLPGARGGTWRTQRLSSITKGNVGSLWRGGHL